MMTAAAEVVDGVGRGRQSALTDFAASRIAMVRPVDRTAAGESVARAWVNTIVGKRPYALLRTSPRATQAMTRTRMD